MLVSQTLELGPFNLPVWLIAAISGYAVAAVVPGLAFKNRRGAFLVVRDALLNGLLAGLLIWKLTPLVTRFEEVRVALARLIYYPGGPAGLIAGVGIGLAIAVVSTVRAIRRSEGADAQPIRWYAFAALLTGAVAATPVAVLSFVRVETAPVDTASVAELLVEADSPAVLVYWATWCGPCTAQMPEVQRFHNSYAESVALYAVNLTRTEKSRSSVQSYLDATGVQLPVVYDSTGRLMLDMDVRATPTTIIFDADHTVVHRRTGAVTAAWIERRVLPLLE